MEHTYITISLYHQFTCVEFSWTVGSASTIEKTETCCSLNALLQF